MPAEAGIQPATTGFRPPPEWRHSIAGGL